MQAPVVNGASILVKSTAPYLQLSVTGFRLNPDTNSKPTIIISGVSVDCTAYPVVSGKPLSPPPLHFFARELIITSVQQTATLYAIYRLWLPQPPKIWSLASNSRQVRFLLCKPSPPFTIHTNYNPHAHIIDNRGCDGIAWSEMASVRSLSVHPARRVLVWLWRISPHLRMPLQWSDVLWRCLWAR